MMSSIVLRATTYVITYFRGPFIPYIVFFFLVGLAWLTHVIVCIKSAAWVFLLAGAIFFPIGIVHGFGVWFHIF